MDAGHIEGNPVLLRPVVLKQPTSMNISDRLTAVPQDPVVLTDRDEVETTTIRTRLGRDRVVGIDQHIGYLLLRDDVVNLSLALDGETVGDMFQQSSNLQTFRMSVS